MGKLNNGKARNLKRILAGHYLKRKVLRHILAVGIGLSPLGSVAVAQTPPAPVLIVSCYITPVNANQFDQGWNIDSTIAESISYKNVSTDTIRAIKFRFHFMDNFNKELGYDEESETGTFSPNVLIERRGLWGYPNVWGNNTSRAFCTVENVQYSNGTIWNAPAPGLAPTAPVLRKPLPGVILVQPDSPVMLDSCEVSADKPTNVTFDTVNFTGALFYVVHSHSKSDRAIKAVRYNFINTDSFSEPVGALTLQNDASFIVLDAAGKLPSQKSDSLSPNGASYSVWWSRQTYNPGIRGVMCSVDGVAFVDGTVWRAPKARP